MSCIATEGTGRHRPRRCGPQSLAVRRVIDDALEAVSDPLITYLRRFSACAMRGSSSYSSHPGPCRYQASVTVIGSLGQRLRDSASAAASGRADGHPVAGLVGDPLGDVLTDVAQVQG